MILYDEGVRGFRNESEGGVVIRNHSVSAATVDSRKDIACREKELSCNS